MAQDSFRGVGDGPWGPLPGLDALRPFRRRALTLKIMAVPFVWPFFLAVIRGAGLDALAIGGGMALLYLGGRLIENGLIAAEGKVPAEAAILPPRLGGALLAGLAAFLISVVPGGDSGLMGLVFAGLTVLGCHLAYGLEEKADLAAFGRALRGTARPDRVQATLAEARRRIGETEAAAASLLSRELKAHVGRIVAQARIVLAQVEERPRDLGRATRFFATYLDGVRDVVATYAAQEVDLADTPLAQNFRRVLTTIEATFREQEAALKRDDRLDLEVRIEVLETQMRQEGVR